MLDRYWPDAAAVNACIKNEAETADVSVLLAVHQPSPLVCRDAGTGITTPASEDDLLKAFLTDDIPGGTLLLPITGPSGSGKSHMIRWLDAQLQRAAGRDKLHIIRIPKSANLRTVVELILAPLGQDPRFAKSRDDLKRAVSEVNADEAVVTFRAHLQNALTTKRDAMREEFLRHPDRLRLKSMIGHAGMLPKMFSDAALDHHFIQNVLSRVVSRALNGRTGEGSDADAEAQFRLDDLVLPERVNLSHAAQPVRDYYQRQIANVEAEHLQPVVELLNSVVDTAIGNVFQLEQSTGGITLQEIILSVREILLKDGKELVLLVEDFAALAGIQEVLLKVCIYEGEYEGKKVRATMRTAMALTDGHLAFRDTILTRAQREWVVGGRQQSDDEVRQAVVQMVGSYLNAARWGEDELRRRFASRGGDRTLKGWLPAWRDEGLNDDEVVIISAFGFASGGEALFPFNRQSIEELANRHLTQAGRLTLNPRRVVNRILREPLLMRSAFMARSFPPPDFQDLRPNAAIANWIRETHQPEAISRRLSSVLAVWGGNPVDPAEIAHIPPSIFSAFGLPTPQDLSNVKFVPSTVSPARAPTQQPEAEGPAIPRVQAAETAKLASLREQLERWSEGAMLGQAEARDIRSALGAVLRYAIDWPSLRIRPVELKPSWIFIPHARGNPQSGLQLKVCEDHRDNDGAVRAGLLAAVRFVDEGAERWDYPGADDDYVVTAAIIDRLIAQLTPKCVEDAIAHSASLGKTLIVQARISGQSPPLRLSNPGAVLSGLFEGPTAHDSVAFEDAWDRIKAHALGPIGTKNAREVLQSELLAVSACFQGDTGRTPFAVDIVRLVDAVSREKVDTESTDGLREEIKAFVRPLTEVRLSSQLGPVLAKLSTFRSEVGEFLADGFDKTGFVKDLQEVVRLLGATGTIPSHLPLRLNDFERRLAEFQASAFMDLVTKAASANDAFPAQLPRVLNALGSIDLGLIARTSEFLKQTNDLISAAEITVSREASNREQSDPGPVAAEIASMLQSATGLTADGVEHPQ